jgi:hypothetical protein
LRRWRRPSTSSEIGRRTLNLIRPRIDGRTVARTAVAVSMGVRSASRRYPKRAEADKATLITRATAAGDPALRAADTGKSAATPDVMCSSKRGGVGTSDVTTAFIGFPVRSHRAGRYPGNQREHGARNNKPSHHTLLRVLRAVSGDRSHRIEIGVGAPRAMTIVPRGPDHGLRYRMEGPPGASRMPPWRPQSYFIPTGPNAFRTPGADSYTAAS